MIGNVIILGDHIQSLGVARIAQRLGRTVILFNSDSVCLTRFSNSCSKFIRFKNEADLLQKLLIFGCSEKDSLIMPTNDSLVYFVLKNFQSLSKKFLLSSPSFEATHKCYDKKMTYQAAENLNIPIPNSYYPKSNEELLEIVEKLDFPVIIKPAIVSHFARKAGKKVLLCKNKGELLSGYSYVLKIIPAEEIIIQEFIRGGARNLYSYCSFIADGVVYGSFVANRIRQKPMDFGFSTTFAISEVNHEISRLAEKYLKGIGFVGLSEVEFMYDPNDNDYKLIEVNPRTWKWHSIANKLDINLIEMLVDYYDNRTVKRKQNKVNGVGWIECVTDTYVVLGEILKGKMSLRQYFNTLRMKKEFACFSRKDLLPGICYLAFLPYLYFSR